MVEDRLQHKIATYREGKGVLGARGDSRRDTVMALGDYEVHMPCEPDTDCTSIEFQKMPHPIRLPAFFAGAEAGGRWNFAVMVEDIAGVDDQATTYSSSEPYPHCCKKIAVRTTIL